MRRLSVILFVIPALAASGEPRLVAAARDLPPARLTAAASLRSSPSPSRASAETGPFGLCGLSAFYETQIELGRRFPPEPLADDVLMRLGRLDRSGRIVTPPLGDKKDFWTWDFHLRKYRLMSATLKVIGERCYLYVDDEATVDNAVLDKVRAEFDGQIYPRVRGAFGEEWNPGIDHDPRITILFTDIRDAHYHLGSGNYIAGYFSPSDEYSEETVAKLGYHSNQREMIYLDMNPATPGSDDQLATMAHEFQHMIHWYRDVDEELWVNEGCSELASFLAGYDLREVGEFARNPENSLVQWGEKLADYEQVMLWTLYFWEHFGGNPATRALTARSENGIEGYNRLLAALGRPIRFGRLFRDWLVANILDDPSVESGRYAYENCDLGPGKIAVTRTHTTPPTSPISADLDAWSVHYVVFQQGGNQKLGFAGPDSAALIEFRRSDTVVRDFSGEIQVTEFGSDGSALVMAVSGGESGGGYTYYWDEPVGPDIDAPLVVGGPWIDSLNPTSCALSWVTSEPGDTRVRYGTDESYGLSYVDADRVISHGAVLTRISPGTTYHFQVGSVDSSGNGPAFGRDYQFTTPAVLSHLADTLSYDNGQPSYYLTDPADLVDLRCVRFTPALPGTLTAALFLFYDRIGDAEGEVVVLNGSGGAPAGTLATEAIPSDSIQAYRRGGGWTRVPLEHLGITLAPGSDFYLGYRTLAPGPGDSLHVIADSGSPATRRSWVRYDDVWYPFGDFYAAPYNLMIRAEFKIDEESLTDIEPPVIATGPQVYLVDRNKALAYWTTDEPATSLVRYGLTAEPDLEVDNPRLDLVHAELLPDLLPDTTYYYRVGSVDRKGNGPAWSGVRTFSSRIEFAPPTSLAAYDDFNGTVPLEWTAPSSDLASLSRLVPGLEPETFPVSGLASPVGYNIHRSRFSGGPYELIAARWPLTFYADSTLANGQVYYYAVSAVYSQPYGESSRAPEVGGTPGRSRMVTIAYDRSSRYAWAMPNPRADQAFAVKFTPGIDGRLYRAEIIFGARPRSGTATVSVWSDEGGRPAQLLGSRGLALNEIFAAPLWTTVSLLGLGVDVAPGRDFYIGLSFTDEEGEILYLVSDEGESGETGRSMVQLSSGIWDSLEHSSGSGYNFRIRALVNHPEASGGLVSGLFALYPNYPNPFNLKTSIQYEVPEEGEVRLEVYDLLGHRVRTLVEEPMPAGRHVTAWDGLDDRGGSLPSGVYFCRLRASGYASTRKMVLVK